MLLYFISLALLLSLVTCDLISIEEALKRCKNGQMGVADNCPIFSYSKKDVKGVNSDQSGVENTGRSVYDEHINYKRSKRNASSKLKHTRVRNSNIHKRNRIRAVPSSYVQTTAVEAIDFVPENLHLNRRQVAPEEYQSKKNVAVGICAGVFIVIFLLCTFMLVRSYRRCKNRASLHSVENPSNDIFLYSIREPEPVLDSDHNVKTKWRINSFLGVVASVVAKLPKTRSMVSSVGHMPSPVNPQQRQY